VQASQFSLILPGSRRLADVFAYAPLRLQQLNRTLKIENTYPDPRKIAGGFSFLTRSPRENCFILTLPSATQRVQAGT
jgi:hypothetical protein